MSIRQNGQIIAGIQSTKCYNIGDIFYTSRKDTALNGAVECNGASYSTADYTGDGSIGELLQDDKLPYVSITQFDSDVASKGSCRCFGWDGGTTFKVPKLADVYIECGTASAPDEFGEESLPNIKGRLTSSGWRLGGANPTGPFYREDTGGDRPSYGTSGGSEWYFDASRSSSTYQDGANVHPKHIKYRAMIQLFNSATDEAVVTCGNVLADVSELKSNKADKLYQDYKSCTNGSIVLEDDKSVYFHSTISSNTTFTFDISNLTKYDDNHWTTFEIIFYMDTASSLTFPSNLSWVNGEAPDTSSIGTYMFSFRKRPTSVNWFGCLEGRW